MITPKRRNELRNAVAVLSKDEQIATAEGLKDEVLMDELLRRYEEMKTMLKTRKEEE